MTTPVPRLSVVPSVPAGEPEPRLEDRSDDDLMLLARGGVGAAFDALVRRYQSRALRLAARHLGRVAAVADVAQNAFLSVYRAIPRYRPSGQFAAYLYRAVLNECRMVRRSERVRGRYHLTLDPALAVGAADVLALTAPAPTAEALVLEREREHDVEWAVARLSDKLRDVVSLRYGAGLPYDQIADTLQIPVGTVKRRLFDALEKLRRNLEEAS